MDTSNIKNPIDARRGLMLTYIEFENIKGHLAYWEKQPNYEILRKCANFELTKKYFIEWTLQFLKQFYPNTKYKILEYKDSVIKESLAINGREIMDDDYDTIAFKFESDRPELYLLIQSGPIILDEYRFDAYDEGPFIRPDWGSS